MNYADLQVTTHFSFLRGASSAEELFSAAAMLGIKALGIVDRNSLAGMVRAHEAAKETGVRLIVGCRLDLQCGTSLLVYPDGSRGLWAPLPSADGRQKTRRQRRLPYRLAGRRGMERRPARNPACRMMSRIRCPMNCKDCSASSATALIARSPAAFCQTKPRACKACQCRCAGAAFRPSSPMTCSITARHGACCRMC